MGRRLGSAGGSEGLSIGLELSFALRIDMVRHSPHVDGPDSLNHS